MAQGYENRRFSRVDCKLPVTMIPREGDSTSGMTRDISPRGLYVISNVELELEDALTVYVSLAGEECAHLDFVDREELMLLTEVVRKDEDGYGLEISGMRQADFELWRGLIINFAEDRATVELEFLTHFDFLPVASQTEDKEDKDNEDEEDHKDHKDDKDELGWD